MAVVLKHFSLLTDSDVVDVKAGFQKKGDWGAINGCLKVNFKIQVCFTNFDTVPSAETLLCSFSCKVEHWMPRMLVKLKHLHTRIETSILIWPDWSFFFLWTSFLTLVHKHRPRYKYWLNSNFVLKCGLLCFVHRSFCSKRCFCRPYRCSVGSGL